MHWPVMMTLKTKTSFSAIVVTAILLIVQGLMVPWNTPLVKAAHAANAANSLTEEQLNFLSVLLELSYPNITPEQLQLVEQEFVVQFNAYPELVLRQLRDSYIDWYGEDPEWVLGANPLLPNSQSGSSRSDVESNNDTDQTLSQLSTKASGHTTTSAGHTRFREISKQQHPDAYKSLEFDSPQALKIRTELSGNLLTFIGESSFSSNFSGSHSKGYKERWVFCQGGIMSQQVESHLSIDGTSGSGQAGVSASSESGMNGLWDVATSNGITIIWIYSDSDYMIPDISATGFLPLPVKVLEHDVLAIGAPNTPREQELLMRRQTGVTC